MKMQCGKCAYCESKIGDSIEEHIGHYRPKRGARGFAKAGDYTARDAVFYDTHYWWLQLEWENVLLTCQKCERFKASWFPLLDEAKRAMANTFGADLQIEAPLLLNPYEDDPDEHLSFSSDGHVQPRTDRGEVTIELLRLNRTDLVEARAQAIRLLRQELANVHDTTGERLKRILGVASEEPYQAALRQSVWALTQEPEQHAWSEQIVALTGEQPRVVQQLPIRQAATKLHLDRLSIERIELHNFRNIADLQIDIAQTVGDGRIPWLVLLGENAVGKSSVLQAIALTLMGRGPLAAFRTDDVLRYFKHDGEIHRCDEGWVRLHVTGRLEPLEIRFRSGESEFESNVDEPLTYVLGYGPTRLLPDNARDTTGTNGLVRVDNLFRATVPLNDANEWLFALWERDRDRHESEDTTFNLMVRGLRTMLRMHSHETFAPNENDLEDRQMLVDLDGDTIRVDHLSDGYRTILALSADLMHILERTKTSTEEAEGIVLIDEIGSNLHPGWKKRVVSCFREVFPRLQFVITTHEPLCLRGVRKGETLLLRRNDDNEVMGVSNLPNPNDLRVDELLSSEFFGLNSTIESDLEEIYGEYYGLLRRKKKRGRLIKAERQREAELKQQLRSREHLGHGLRDELMYEVLDKVLARHERDRVPNSRDALKAEVVEKVIAAWKEHGLS
jgi:uncharacterized protein (TIGR02646 family)